MSNGQGSPPGGPNVVSLSAELMRAGKVLPTVAQIAITGEDQILIEVLSNLAGTVQMTGRFLDAASGKIIPMIQSFPFQAFVDVSTIYFPGIGYLLGADFGATHTNGAINGAPPFVTVFQVRGTSVANFFITNTIAMGYTSGTGNYNLPWPQSPIQLPHYEKGYFNSHLGATPAAGNEISEIVQSATVWHVHAFKFLLNTSAAAGNRFVALRYRNVTTGALLTFPSFFAHPPSTLIQYNYFHAAPAGQAAQNQQIVAPLERNYRLTQPFAIETATQGLAAGDQYSNVNYFTDEWRNF